MGAAKHGRAEWLAALLCAGAVAAGTAAGAGTAPPIAYPPAPRGDTVDDYHGVRIPDPYRGFEDLDSPATRGWLAAETALTDRYLAAMPRRARLRHRLAELFDYERFGVPFREGGRLFFTRNTGLENQSRLLTAATPAAPARLVLDPNRLAADGSRVVVGYVASRDGRRLAYGVSVSGSDWTEWRVRDVASGADLPDVLRFTKYYPPAFAADGAGLYYSAFPPPPAGTELSAPDLRNAVYYHALGTPAARDRKLLEFPGHPDWQYQPSLSEDGRWLIVTVGAGEVGDKGVENLVLIDLASAARAPRQVAGGFEAAYVFAGSDAGRLYFLTTLDAPNGRVIGIDPQHPDRAAWQSVVAAGPDAIDLTETSVTLVDHQLLVRTLHDAHSRVTSYGLDGRKRREIALPGIGTAAGFAGHADDRETYFSFTNLVTPATVLRLDLESGRSEPLHAAHAAFDPGAFEQRQVFYPAKDGTRIPLLLAYRKGLRLDGANPVLLYGYGGFGIPVLPTFAPSRIAWLELGGIYAIANVRGGGEYGEAWHLAASRSHKQVVFDDFIAAAEWLVAQRYTSAAKLAIRGESNGGLLVGACITQRPDLYRAAIAGVGVMDMLRFDRFGQGAGWTGEYGSPQDPADLKFLLAYSPLQNVRAGTRYPATLIITGDHDTRVMPMHSFKFAAALQAAQAGPQPVLLYIEKSSGHGGGANVSQEIEQNADIDAFLADRLGVDAAPAE